jgi:hypothetical protein
LHGGKTGEDVEMPGVHESRGGILHAPEEGPEPGASGEGSSVRMVFASSLGIPALGGFGL